MGRNFLSPLRGFDSARGTLRNALPAAIFAVLWVLSAPSPTAAVDPSISPAAQLQSIDANWNLNFKSGSDQSIIPAANLSFRGELRDSSAGTQVLLADGSLIVAADVRLEGESLVVDSSLFGEPEGLKITGSTRLPLNIVRGVVFRVPLEPLARDALLKQLAASAGSEDQLLLANGDVVAGTLAKLQRLDLDDGKAGPLAVAIETRAGTVEIKPDEPAGQLLEKVAAIIFNPALVRAVRPAGMHVLIGFRDGTRLAAARVEPNQEQAVFELVSGGKIASHPDESIWPQITFLQTFGGKAKYLSDLTPAFYEHAPLLTMKWPLGVNENVLGGGLRAAGQLYMRGLGMHSSSRAVFGLADSRARRLQAELAIDESCGDRGSVIFAVAVDVDGKFKIAYKSPVVRGGDAPLPMSVDVAGARRIALIVDAADHGTELDRANWLNARLVE